MYSRLWGNVRMDQLTQQISHARELVERSRARDRGRDSQQPWIVLVAGVWFVSFVWLIYLANRMSQPIRQLTAGLSEVAAGNLQTRIATQRSDEIGRAIEAFNRTAGELQQNRDRLVYLTQIASWQLLARKMAHESSRTLSPPFDDCGRNPGAAAG